ncbi:hypothetical protein FRC03_001006 [Tulasnella sp. 419]|nr:hypothetical protein FRC03_001006 [Tulasnella sp. 419]
MASDDQSRTRRRRAMTDETKPPLTKSPSSDALLNLPAMPSLNFNVFSTPFEKFLRETEAADWAGAFTLLDTLETYFDSRLDLLERNLKKQGEKLKVRANEGLARMKTPTGERYAKDIEKEVQKFKIKVTARMAALTTAWQSAKVVRTREKLSFFYGVMSVLFTTLLYATAPEWLHIVYTVQALLYIPVRWYTYKKRAYHYFLFDLCYYVNLLCLIYIWILPQNETLWLACYLLTHGSLASAVITWRNSLVFHDIEKVVSIFIHIYPLMVFTVIRHLYPNVEERFPAVVTSKLQPMKSLALSAAVYLIWQMLYYKFVLIDRRSKIESGQRTTSFTWMLNDKRGVIGRMLQRIPQSYRELSFMGGQLAYTIITELPAVYLLYDRRNASHAFLLFIFAVSVWNGGGFYIEVFGRKFERELEALRKELAEANAKSSTGSITPMSGALSPSVGPSMPSSPLHGSGDKLLSEHASEDHDALPSGASSVSDLDHDVDVSVTTSNTGEIVDGPESPGTSPIVVGGPGTELDLKDGFKLDAYTVGSSSSSSPTPASATQAIAKKDQ